MGKTSEAKFKVGDRVRFVEDYGQASKGDEAVVIGYSKTGCVCLDVNGAPHTCYEQRVEPANDNSPIRTVTRREIVPGTYDVVEVETDGWLSVKFDEAEPTASTLRSAARIFNEIADVLDEQSAEANKEAA